EKRVFEEVAAKLETIRRNAYAMVSRIFAHVEEYGAWIAVTEEAVRDAEVVTKYVREELAKAGLGQLAERYTVRALPIYLEPEEAKHLLESAAEHLERDIDELIERIKKAENEQTKSSLKRLQQDLEYRKKLLEAFRKYLQEVSRL
ncbi:hypothetical protein, partial [Infirmifilum sp.]|uniref:hypothetical protein n=1 Tax=Infirmifilum sp. TaxID=2856575 RepID=UPI003D0CBC06